MTSSSVDSLPQVAGGGLQSDVAGELGRAGARTGVESWSFAATSTRLLAPKAVATATAVTMRRGYRITAGPLLSGRRVFVGWGTPRGGGARLQAWCAARATKTPTQNSAAGGV